jgi:hypothetical protein
MPKELESNEDRPETSEPVGGDSGPAEHQRGFRHWMTENSETLRVFLLIGSYVSVMLSLISFIALGGSKVISRIFAASALGCALFALELFRIDAHVDKGGRTLWQVFRKPKTERVEKRIALILWVFIAVSIALLLLYPRHP